MNISAAVIARDSQDTILKCIQSLRLVTQDIVVIVDDRSLDNTYNIAKQEGVNVSVHKFADFSTQKNYASALCKKEWILSLDADEWISGDLADELLSLSENVPESAFILPRKNIIFGKTINHTNWDPNGLIRLYRKKSSRWAGSIHEHVQVKGNVGQLTNPIYHQNYTSVSEFFSRQDKYSSLEAIDLFSDGVRFSIWMFATEPPKEFFRRYLWHTGYLDGLHGLFLSYLMAIYKAEVWVKLWQKEANRS